jgi:hypothetical protein
MVAAQSNRRSDGQLGLILYETANWTVNGRQGVVFCEVASLRIAIDEALEFTARGHDVVALVRRRPAEIVVFSGQVRKLEDLSLELEFGPIFQIMKA